MKPSRSFLVTGQQGMALVAVLSVLILLTVLVVGLLFRAATERTAASAYYAQTQTGILADTVVKLVQAQIDHAASRTNTAWASQPGMVRTFRPDGDLLLAYKLYSDTTLTANTVNAVSAEAALQSWSASPAHFVDINEPVKSAGVWNFPILDPSSLDKTADGEPMIQGFSITNAPDITSQQPIPMPVRWLYVLQDGQIVAPSNGNGTTAIIPGATSANPMVGRIAFWTDDETSKLNINTASHGYFWDIPRAFTLAERDRMARFQPTLHEFQRYPGHPATTSLWPVLGYKSPSEAQFADFVYQLIPRISQGGSEGGTRFASASAVLNDKDRLYTSVDELLFSAHLGARAPQAVLNRADIERAKFFLTARSNNPEINLFNLPRMAIWPVNSGSKTPSTLDKVIAFCSSINGRPYYFQRENPNSPHADMALDSSGSGPGRNQQLYDYINTLLSRPFPGFGNTTFVDKYTLEETRQITTEIFDYIRSSNLFSTALGATAYTGNGSNPLDSSGSRAGQTTPLLIGDSKGFGRLPALSQAVFHLYVSGLESAKGVFPSTAFPMQTGRLPYFSEDFWDDVGNYASGSYGELRKFLDSTGVGNDVNLLTSGIIYFDTFDPMLGYTRPRYNFKIRVSFSGAWQVNGKSLGFEDGEIEINRDQISLYNAKTNAWESTYVGRFFGGALGPLWMMQNYTYLKGNPPNDIRGFSRAYPLSSERIAIHLPITLVDENVGRTDTNGNPLPSKATLPPSGNITDSVSFSGGGLTAQIMVDGEAIQTYHFDFPEFTKPAPTYVPRDYIGTRPDLPATDADIVLKQLATNVDFRNRWVRQPFNNKKQQGGAGHIGGHSADCCDVWLIQNYDVIVALEPASGDKRILAARKNLKTGTTGNSSQADFIPNKDYDSATIRVAADFREDVVGTDLKARAEESGKKPGRLIDIAYGQNAAPDIPSRFPNGVKDTTIGGFWPDFDNGTLHAPDDAYVNRADEGSANTNISDDLLGSDTGNRGFSWYGDNSGSTDNALFFSPNKQMPSAGMFGSLPTGVVRRHPWQTLLFRPNPGGSTAGHPGASSPEDFLLLDLFWMPVVEPYAISERFSSNGKVNMNYQIMPFRYIHRATAMLGVLQNQEVITLQNSDASQGVINSLTGYGKNDQYKKYSFNDLASSMSGINIRQKLNLSSTNGILKSFEDLFSSDRIFRSETQICSIPLIPQDGSWSSNFESEYWDERRLTGDNSREMPYAQLLPRLTTRSNTFSVHYRVQSIKIPPDRPVDTWDENTGRILAEQRGSRTIERYIDPNATTIPDYASQPTSQPSLDAFYRWRTLHNQLFLP